MTKFLFRKIRVMVSNWQTMQSTRNMLILRKNCGFPMVQYTDEDLSRITAIGTDIYKYVEAQYAHWVVDGGIDDEWDSYIDQLKAMGIDEFLQIQTDAYNSIQRKILGKINRK